MTVVHGKGTKVYGSGYDLTSFFKKAGVSGEAELPDATTFGNNSKVYGDDGLLDATLKAEGLFAYDELELTLDKSDEVLAAALNQDPSTWAICFAGDVMGYPCDLVSAIEGAYEIEADLGDLVQVSAEAQSKVGKEPGRILHPMGQETATGNGTTYDAGAAGMPTAFGGAGYLQVKDVSGGGPSVTVKIQHSADASVWVDLITFAAVTADHGHERVAVTGTVNRYLRAIWTIAASTAPVFHVAFNRKLA